MMIAQESVNIEKKTRDAGKLAVDFLVKVKAALKLGMPLLEAIKIGSAALEDLVPVLQEVDALKAEAVEDILAEMQTVFLIGKDLYNALRS